MLFIKICVSSLFVFHLYKPLRQTDQPIYRTTDLQLDLQRVCYQRGIPHLISTYLTMYIRPLNSYLSKWVMSVICTILLNKYRNKQETVKIIHLAYGLIHSKYSKKVAQRNFKEYQKTRILYFSKTVKIRQKVYFFPVVFHSTTNILCRLREILQRHVSCVP